MNRFIFKSHRLAWATIVTAILILASCKQQSNPISKVKTGTSSGEYVHYVLSDAHVDPRDLLSSDGKTFNAKEFVNSSGQSSGLRHQFSAHTRLFGVWLNELKSRITSAGQGIKGFTIVFNGDPFQRAPFEQSIEPAQRVTAMENFGALLREVASSAGEGKSVEVLFNAGDHEFKRTKEFWGGGDGKADFRDVILQKESALLEALTTEEAGKPKIKVVSSDARLGQLIQLNGGEVAYLRHIQYEISENLLAEATGGYEGNTVEEKAAGIPERLKTVHQAIPQMETYEAIANRAKAAGVTGEITIITSDSHMPVTDLVKNAAGEFQVVGTGTMSSSAKGLVPNTIVEIANGQARHLAINAEFAKDANRNPTDVKIEKNLFEWNPKTELLEKQQNASDLRNVGKRAVETITQNRLRLGPAPADDLVARQLAITEKEILSNRSRTQEFNPRERAQEGFEGLEDVGADVELSRKLPKLESDFKAVQERLALNKEFFGRSSIEEKSNKSEVERLKELSEKAEKILRESERGNLRERLIETDKLKLQEIIRESKLREK